MNQTSEKPETPPARLVIASCDAATHVQSTGVDITARVNEAVTSDLEVMSGIGTRSRVYIALENMRGTFDAAVLRIHLRIFTAQGRILAGEAYLGSIALYGLRIASSPRSDGKSTGLTSHLDVTAQAKGIIGQTLPPDAQFQVSVRPHNALPEGEGILIERIRLYIEPVETPAV